MSFKIIKSSAPRVTGARYPVPLHLPCAGRERLRLGDAAGLDQFGVNLTSLPPGAWSSQRHWHSAEDEFVFVLQGSLVLVTDEGEELLNAGDAVGFAAGCANGHHFQNRSAEPASFLEIGSRRPDEDETTYSDVDLMMPKGRKGFTRKSGEAYSAEAFDSPRSARPALGAAGKGKDF